MLTCRCLCASTATRVQQTVSLNSMPETLTGTYMLRATQLPRDGSGQSITTPDGRRFYLRDKYVTTIHASHTPSRLTLAAAAAVTASRAALRDLSTSEGAAADARLGPAGNSAAARRERVRQARAAGEETALLSQPVRALRLKVHQLQTARALEESKQQALETQRLVRAASSKLCAFETRGCNTYTCPPPPPPHSCKPRTKTRH